MRSNYSHFEYGYESSSMFKKKTPIEIVFILSIVFSIFSQVDSLGFVVRPAMYALWIVLIMLGVIHNRGKILISQRTRVFLAMYTLYAVFILMCGVFNNNFFEARYLRVLIVPLFITIFVDICPYDVVEDYELIAKVFIISSVIFAITVQRSFISSYNAWLSAESYVYSQKNSAAQIWFCSILLSWFLITPKTMKERVLWYGLSGYLLIVAGLSQCRTAILSFGIGLVNLILFRSKHKVRWLVSLAGVIAFVIINPITNRYINQALLLERYAGADLNTLSSGRLSYFARAIQTFLESPIIGVGTWYVDCSYLLILAESGIIGFILIETIWTSVLMQNIRYGFFSSDANKKKDFVIIITSFYLVESIFEGFPPFGPGVSSLGFWLFVGLLIRLYDLKRKKKHKLDEKRYE